MKYIAMVIMPSGRSSDRFETVSEAKQWLDTQNVNHQYTTIIGEVNDQDMVVDWFFYTVVER